MSLLPYLPSAFTTLLILGVFYLYKKIAVVRKGDNWLFVFIWLVTCGPSIVTLVLAKLFWT